MPAIFHARPRRLRRVASWRAGVIALVSGAAVLGGSAAQAAQAAPAAASRPAAAAVAADPQTLASAQARRTGKPVTITAMTTPTSQTQALPGGGFKLVTSAAPVRTWTSTGWQTLNANLHANPDGTWSPQMATSPVTISGGGSGPLAVMTSQGKSLALSWPGPLPAPVISGDTATYPSVQPGVDLRVTVGSDGGFSDVLVIHNRAAGAALAAKNLTLGAAASGGLHLSAGPGGTLQATAGSSAAPVFTAAPALEWDSAATAPLPTRAAAATAGPQAAGAAAGGPAASTADQPGRRAHIGRVTDTVTAPRQQAGRTVQSLSLIPDAALLTSPSAVYPAYVDPTWIPSGASRGWYASDDDEFSTSNYYDNTADPSPESYLQVGYGGSFNAHTFVQMKLDAGQLSGAQIQSSTLQFTLEHSWSCTGSEVDLWWVGGVPSKSGKPWVSWNDEPSWNSKITSLTVAHGNTGCAAATIDFDISSFMQSKGPAGPSTMTFGLKAPDSGDTSTWKEFSNASGAITMTTYYDHPPAAQKDTVSSPGGACQTASGQQVTIGNDDVTLETTPSDPDGGSLTTTFVIKHYQAGETASAFAAATPLQSSPVVTSSGQPTVLPTIQRTTFQGWLSGGSTFGWYTSTADSYGLTNNTDNVAGSLAQPCIFTYNPNGPSTPGVVEPGPIAGTSDGAIGTLGTTATFTFANCTAALDPGGTCSGTAPVSYMYQVNDGTQTTIPVSGTQQQVTIPLTAVGANTITVVGISVGGTPSQAANPPLFYVDAPAVHYEDGDYAGTGQPDLITIGNGSQPGLWMAESDGAGHLSTPVDIGARGTGLGSPTPNGWTFPPTAPAAWTGEIPVQVLHGDFTGHGVQDIAAYYPNGAGNNGVGTGTLQVLDGPGTNAPLNPESGSAGSTVIPPDGTLDANFNYVFGDGNEQPLTLVAAGNASMKTIPQGQFSAPDLIGIVGQPGDSSGYGYELAMYPSTPDDFLQSAYSTVTELATPSQGPGGASGDPWNDFSLAVAQPSSGGPVLFALDTTNGQVWESVNTSQSTSTLIGMPGTWTQITGGPGAGQNLAQADINAAGNIELWTTTGATATAWVLSNGALTSEAVNNLTAPAHEWPLSDGATDAVPNTASLIDTQTGTGYATPSTGLTTSSFPDDPVFGPVAQFTGSADTSLTLPAGIMQNTAATGDPALQSMTLSLRFNADPGKTGIIAGTSIAAPSAADNHSAPILYIGTDGHLYAQFPSAHVSGTMDVQDITPLVSPARVDDGQWHTVTLVADGTNHDQILYLDNNIPIHLVNNGYLATSGVSTAPVIINPGQNAVGQSYNPDQVTIGAGAFSDAGWTNADGTAGTARASYFTGMVSDITFYTQALAPNQLPRNTPAAVTSTNVSALAPTLCMDNTGGSATSPGTLTNFNPVQIWTCNGYPSQNWTFDPDGTIHLAAATGSCLDVTHSGTANGTLVDLFVCNGTGAQKWQLLSNGSVMNPESGRCLSGSTTNGTQLDLFNCNGTVTTEWSSTARPPQGPAVGTIVSMRTGLCVANAGTTTTSGTLADHNPIQLQTCNGSPAQQWSFDPNEATISLASQPGWCIDLTSGGTANGTNLQLYSCLANTNQQWAHPPDTGAIVDVNNSTLCIDGRANTVGTQIQIWGCNQTDDQTWIDPSTYNH